MITPRRLFFSLAPLALLVVYFTSLRFGFLTWDDDVNITANPSLLGARWSELWGQSYYGLYVPVSYTAWALLAKLGMVPLYFHAANLLVHLLNGILCYAVLAVFVGEGAALWGALFFLLHPLQVETVCWASGLRDLLSVFFGLAAWRVHLRAPGARRDLAAMTLFFLALMAKPSVAALPLGAWAFDFWWRRPTWRREGLALLPWVVAALAIPWITAAAQQNLGDGHTVAWFLTPLVAINSFGFYLIKVVAPYPLAVDYGLTPAMMLQHPYGVLVVAAAGLAAWRLRVSRWLALAALLLLPVLGFVPFAFQYISTVADHYMYLPMLAGAGLFATLAAHAKWGPAVLLILLAGVAQARTTVWQNDAVFFADMVAKNPSSFEGYVGLGDGLRQKNEWEQAANAYRNALRISPVNGLAILNLCLSLSTLGHDAEVVALLDPVFNQPLKLNSENTPYYANLYYYYATAQSHLGQNGAAYRYFCAALHLEKDNQVLRESVRQARAQATLEPECAP